MKNVFSLVILFAVLSSCADNTKYLALKACTDAQVNCIESCQEVDLSEACDCKEPSTPQELEEDLVEDEIVEVDLNWAEYMVCLKTCQLMTQKLIQCRRDCQKQFSDYVAEIEQE